MWTLQGWTDVGRNSHAGPARRSNVAPQARLTIAGHDVLLLGTVAGYVPDGDRVRQAYDAFRPQTVALGVPAEDLAGLDVLARGPSPEEMPDLDDASQRLLQMISAYGPTRIPSPDLEAAHAVAQGDGVPLRSLDLDDDAHAEAFTSNVNFLHVLQSNAIKSRLMRRGIKGNDAYDLATAWDAAWTRPKGLRKVDALREAHMAERLQELARSGSVLAVVPCARLPGIVALLTARSP